MVALPLICSSNHTNGSGYAEGYPLFAFDMKPELASTQSSQRIQTHSHFWSGRAQITFQGAHSPFGDQSYLCSVFVFAEYDIVIVVIKLVIYS